MFFVGLIAVVLCIYMASRLATVAGRHLENDRGGPFLFYMIPAFGFVVVAALLLTKVVYLA